ncbi:MAG: hypothetical protein Q4C68_02935 [Moraxella sp.]|nr:hypothetical protein [Moraxella sp.]
MTTLKITVLFATLALVGCSAKQSITPQYINPNAYANYDCQTLSQEIKRIETLATDTEKQQTSLSATGMGIGITGGRHGIYPTISFGVGKNTNHANKKHTLSRLYGEHDAMVVAARQKGCAFVQGVKIYGE